MTKVVFFFAGTNDTAKEYYRRHGNDYTNFNADDDLIKIYVDGCQAIGKSALNPDLKKPTNLIQQAFSQGAVDHVTLDLARLKRDFGDAVFIVKQEKGSKKFDQEVQFKQDSSMQSATRVEQNSQSNVANDGVQTRVKPDKPLNMVYLDTPQVAIDAIITTGFSRGAWTANLMLPKLDRLNIPLYCISDQAVTGKRRDHFGKNKTDCSNIKNLKYYFAFVGDYHKHTSGIERNWFYQWLPKLSEMLYKANRLILFYVPHQDHFESHKGKSDVSPTNFGFVSKLTSTGDMPKQEAVSPVTAHMRSALERCVNDSSSPETVNESLLSVYAIDWYYQKFLNNQRYYFTPEASKLPVDGMDDNEAQGIKLESDPCYFEALLWFIQDKLKSLGVRRTDKLSVEQASAIYHLFPESLSADILHDARVQLILSQEDFCQNQRDAFIKIVNEIGPICDYMCQDRQILNVRGERRERMRKAIDVYQKAILDACYDYIWLPDSEDKIKGAKQFGDKIAVAERNLSLQLVNFTLLHSFFQMIRDAIATRLKWGTCYAREANDTNFAKLKLPFYASAYIRVKTQEGEDALYYVNPAMGVQKKLEHAALKAYDAAMQSTNKELSKDEQKVISILTGFNLQPPSRHRHRFFVPTPSQVLEYGAQKIMNNIENLQNKTAHEPSQAENRIKSLKTGNSKQGL